MRWWGIEGVPGRVVLPGDVGSKKVGEAPAFNVLAFESQRLVYVMRYDLVKAY